MAYFAEQKRQHKNRVYQNWHTLFSYAQTSLKMRSFIFFAVVRLQIVFIQINNSFLPILQYFLVDNNMSHYNYNTTFRLLE